MEPLLGIHHVTAIAGDASKNFAFFVGRLGMRCVKKTVNYDDSSSYHLYYGDRVGSPGSLITYFPIPGAARGTRGRGEVAKICLSSRQVDPGDRAEASDPDGLPLELRHADSDWSIDRVVLAVGDIEPTRELLIHCFGSVAQSDLVLCLGASFIELEDAAGQPRSRISAGSVHHIAFRCKNDDHQLACRETLVGRGYTVSPVMDRTYFKSIYFREPSGILFEIATDGPGMQADEPIESLGTELKLPARYEPYRNEITSNLPSLLEPQ